MRILIDITHPAHVHFFKNPIAILKEQGHQILITSRIKDNATQLLDDLNLKHEVLSSESKNKNLFLFLKELIKRDYRLSKFIYNHKPDVLGAIGGTFIAHSGLLTNTPSVIFYDTENANLQNLITYPFASLVVVPKCYESWLPKKSIRYSGYHELSYLDSKYFEPNKGIALQNGIEPEKDNFLIRLVSWNANHDIGESGLSQKTIEKVTNKLLKSGNVIISSESKLPSSLVKYKYNGNFSDIHHVLSQCKAFIGESATMASEAVILGIPTVYAANTSRGYINEQEEKYGILVKPNNLEWENIENAIEKVLSINDSQLLSSKNKLKKNTIDVAKYTAEQLTNSI